MDFGCALFTFVWFKFDSLGLLLFESCAHSTFESKPFLLFILFTLSDELDVVVEDEADDDEDDDEVNKVVLVSMPTSACGWFCAAAASWPSCMSRVLHVCVLLVNGVGLVKLDDSTLLHSDSNRPDREKTL